MLRQYIEAERIRRTGETGIEILEERVQRIYKDSPTLKRLMTGRKEDVSIHKLRLRNMYHRIAWAGSLTSLAHRSIKILVMDEVDKYSESTSEREVSTVELAKVRCRNFSDRRILMHSYTSVEEGFIWTELTKETQAVFVYWSRCPFCDTEQLMDFTKDTFWWPKGEDGHSLDRMEIESRKLARYICTDPGCRQMWDDDARSKAQRLAMRGCWRLRTEDEICTYTGRNERTIRRWVEKERLYRLYGCGKLFFRL